MLLSFYYPLTLRHDWRIERDLLVKESDELDARIHYLTTHVERLKKLVDTTLANQGGKYDPGTDKLVLHYSEAEIKEMEATVHTEKRDYEIADAAFHHQLRRIAALDHELAIVETLAYIGIAIGGLLASFGYLLWYTRIQRYQDSALRNPTDPA